MQSIVRTSAACLAAGALAVPLARPARAELVETRPLTDRVPVDSSKPLRIVVDDVFGFVHVVAHDAPVVEMRATETRRAKSQSDLARSRTEAGLRIEHGDGEVAYLVRRLDEGCDRSHRFWDGYVVKYDIELLVPRDAVLDLATVNEGDIVVDGVRGDFEVANVNGAVRLRGLRGAGHARTVNGPLDASFEGAPAGDASFETVNGRIEVEFPENLSADLLFQTMHGDVLTDFHGAPLSSTPTRERTPDGRGWVIRSGSRSGLRVAAGGPTYSFKTLNGDILVRNGGREAARTQP
jgi:hypothetical protein